jgi:hypothetical protein
MPSPDGVAASQKLRSLPLLRLPAILVWAWVPTAVAGGIGVLIVTIGTGSTDQVRVFSATPEYRTWIFSVLAMISIQTIASVSCLGAYRSLRSALTGWRKRVPVVAALVFAVLVFVTQALIQVKDPPFFFPLPYFKWRLAGLTVLVVVAARPAIVGMWSVLVAVGDVGPDSHLEPPASSTENDAAYAQRSWSHHDAVEVIRLARLDSCLQLFLAAGGVVIGTTTLSVGALRNAMLAAKLGYTIPVEHVLIYGLGMTMYLATIYYPVDLSLRERAQALIDRIRPLPVDEIPTQEWVDERDRLGALLHLDKRRPDSARVLIAVFAPFIGSLVSTVLPHAS